MKPWILLGSLLPAFSLAADAPVTFYKDVLPVLQKNCQGCHRPGEAGPMSFLSYESTRPWAKSIKAAVVTRKMPPWFAEPQHAKYSNDRSLLQADINTLSAWADSGAEAGLAADAPPPVKFTPGWAIGKPDVIIEVPKPVSIQARGTMEYQYVIVPTGFAEDKWVQFAEARPTDREHTHHILAYLRPPGSEWMAKYPKGEFFEPVNSKEGGGPGDREILGGYAPGTMPYAFQPGQARLIPAGSDIVFQMHYTTNGKASSDLSSIGLIFAKEPPKVRMITVSAGANNFTIPPNAENFKVDARVVLSREATMMSLLPHMHLRGKSFDYRITYPTGEKETILNVPHYEFGWQLTYELEKPRLLPKGTIIECTAVFDNSANNRFNPDPTQTVKYGEQSWDEMMVGFFELAVPLRVGPADVFEREQRRAEYGRGPAQQ